MMVIKKHISTLESLNFHFLLDESLLEPYVSKGTRTVLRRGKESNFSPLSDVHVKCRVSGTGHIRLRLRHRNILGETGLTVILPQLQIQLQVMSEQSGVKMGTL